MAYLIGIPSIWDEVSWRQDVDNRSSLYKVKVGQLSFGEFQQFDMYDWYKLELEGAGSYRLIISNDSTNNYSAGNFWGRTSVGVRIDVTDSNGTLVGLDPATAYSTTDGILNFNYSGATYASESYVRVSYFGVGEADYVVKLERVFASPPDNPPLPVGLNLIGTAGDDSLIGDEGNDSITGGEGSDFMVGFGGNDTLSGGRGDDILSGGGGNDLLDGGDGFDLASYVNAMSGVTVSLITHTSAGGDGVDNLVSIEQISGSDFSDSITGDDLKNSLFGGSGDDRILGMGGDDLLVGEAGNDTLDGGPGVDIVYYDGIRANFRISKVAGRFQVTDRTGVEGSDSLVGFELMRMNNATFALIDPTRVTAPEYGRYSGFLFDSIYYLLAYSELVPTTLPGQALQHYTNSGAAQGKLPNSWFDANYYKSRWSDLTPLNLDNSTLFQHYNLFGVWEGRSAGPKFDRFDGSRYLSENPDVAAYVDGNLPAFLGSRSNGAIAHFIIYGSSEQRVAYDASGVMIDMGYVV